MPIGKEDRLLRIGVLGCGPVSQFAHFDACRKARNAELYAICDVSDDLLTRMAAVHSPHITYRDYGEMLADPQVEAIIIATSDEFHVPLCAQAVDAGKHVLVEKPLGVSIEECESLRDQLRPTRLVLQIGNNRRFDPGMTFAWRFIQDELGELMAIKAWYHDSIHRYTMTDNLQPIPITSPRAKRPLGDPKADKRRYFLLAHGSHLVDTMRFLGGDVLGAQARLVHKFGAFCWFASVDLAGGAVGHLDLTISVRGDFEEGFRVYGEYGSVTGRLYLPWYHKSGEVECFSVKDDVYRRPLGQDAYTYKLQIEGFADTILHGKPMLGANIEDGVAAMRALVTLSRSAATGEYVRLSEVHGGV
jgi:predicted dehydrogenase